MKIGDKVYFVSGDKVLSDILHTITKGSPSLYHTNRCSNLLKFQVFTTELEAYQRLFTVLTNRLESLSRQHHTAAHKIVQLSK